MEEIKMIPYVLWNNNVTCRIISRRKCRCICVSFLGNGVLKKFLMIISLFVGHMSPWHCFILKEIKRLFGVGLIVIKALFRYWWSKNARIFFYLKVLDTLTASYFSAIQRRLIMMKFYKFLYQKKIYFNKVYCLEVLYFILT